MKIIGTFGIVVIASIALLQPAEGRGRAGGGGGRSFSSGHSFSSGSRNFSGGSRSFSSSGPRSYSRGTYSSSSQAAYRNRSHAYSRSSPRYSSQARYRNRTDYRPRQVADNRTNSLNRRTGSDLNNARFAPNRRTALQSQRFNNGTRVAGNHTRNWSRNRDHNWNGRRCRWHNNSWVIIGPWFPWGYGYYPYGAYSYYDDGYYNNGYYDDRYATSENSQAEYADSSVSQVQAALAREGYYHGAIDGSVGPATRNALRRYQRNHGLDATGQIDQPVIEALGLR